MARINSKQLMVDIMSNPRVLKKEAEKIARREVFTPAVRALQIDFESSPVTAEIKEGVGAQNYSNSLLGYFKEDYGKNLYSFIGFTEGDPTNVIRTSLSENSPSGPKLKYSKMDRKRGRFEFVVRGPNLESIYAQTPMPWANGISWASRIERGISGLSNFLNRKGLKNSRSGGGIQIKNRILRTGRYQRQPYLRGMVRKFFSRVTRVTR